MIASPSVTLSPSCFNQAMSLPVSWAIPRAGMKTLAASFNLLTVREILFRIMHQRGSKTMSSSHGHLVMTLLPVSVTMI